MGIIKNIFSRIQSNQYKKIALKKANVFLDKNNKQDFKDFISFRKNAIQSFGEGWRDIMSFESIIDSSSTEKQPDENNYKTYENQVRKIYEMYYGQSKYGGEVMRGIIDTRVAMLCGEGINVNVYPSEDFEGMENQNNENEEIQAFENEEKKQDENIDQEKNNDIIIEDEKRKKVEDFISNFIKKNKLNTLLLYQIGEIAEMEGKVLLVLNIIKEKKKSYIKIDIFSWYQNKYNIQKDNATGKILKITYGNDNKEIPLENVVFIQMNGVYNDCVMTPPRAANVLTQIENYSRAKYDLRKNNHLFAKTTPFFETQDKIQSDAINNDIQKKKWKIGMGYAGTAKFSYVSQSTGASDSIEKERIMDIKDIATTMGLPIFFMNYPELMSNRSTAETMMESVIQSTKKERVILEDSLRELIMKAMQMSVDNGIENAIYEPDMFDVKLPLITADTMKQVVEVFVPLMDAKLLSKESVMGKIPGINPIDEKKLINTERENNMKYNPFINSTMNEVIKENQNINNKDEKKIQSFKNRRKNGNNIKQSKFK